ncbi:putative fatty acyl-CoA reductase CG5065 [Aricia agestis]|uniref:putative fatty acyl-CoA reductase CG5065 n=1 Tax=Aricia agestis TaxID=91739 RepID=UPI001C20BAD3|nr:putative fatty acyl-CoA reductase CG5065 [Aricia agestis]XP_041971172.1 putative fatty acyl-CoA reductase CG5065 [Aricia agestis]XP_041971173.1 putative fatty acyl-CoA reductase CG5065 [Aricia agestis]
MSASIGVSEYYADKSIFITGATGFMGKVLVEKLLRSCPDISRIYLLMRPKKGQNIEQRLDDFINCRIFDKLQVNSPKCFKKLHLIAGDVLKEDLGISIEDWDLLQKEVNIVFHCAACVRFDMFIKDAVDLNMVGTLRALKLAEGMKNLEAFVHVSTAYCRCELESLDEKLYPFKHDPHKVMDMVEWMDHNTLARLEKELIHPQPNTYAYTKSLTEDLVAQYAHKFPIAIARPSIVTAAYKEPLPGWIDNLNGPTGLMVGAGKGVIRTMQCNQDYNVDVLPVDMTINGCILLAYFRALDKSKEVRVCNLTQSGVNPITWGEALELGRYHVKDYPFSICLWYPNGGLKSNRVHHELALFFTHLVPAYLIDFLAILMGRKPFMVKIQKRVSYGLGVLQYYTTKQWHFNNDYFRSMGKALSAHDNEVFFTDINLLNWSDYIKDYIKGAREFCCKEDPSTLPQARRLHKQLYYLDLFVKLLFLLPLVYCLYTYLVKLFL